MLTVPYWNSVNVSYLCSPANKDIFGIIKVQQ